MDVDSTEWRKATTGKLRRQRKKLHIAAKNPPVPENQEPQLSASAAPLPITTPDDNLFAGLDIDIGSIKKTLTPDDVQSTKSYKSVKSQSGKALSKKDKIKLRRQILLRKIDTVNQMKNEVKLRAKRKTTAIIGDTNPLHDALPSLESLLKNRSSVKRNVKTSKKGIEKASKRKQKLVEGVQMFKLAMKNKDFKKNPFEAISNHIKVMVQRERSQKR